MECKAGAAVISESELSKSVKNLKATKGCEHTDSLEYDAQIADKLAKLYKKHDADLRAIFKDDRLIDLNYLGFEQELDENPRKVLKYPPTSAEEFGMRYAQGFYTYAEAK